MSEYLAARFAEMLTKGEVLELFRMLEQRYGTITKVCERIGIERKTFYYWRYARRINSETKAKVLKAVLEEYPIDTLEFLARKARSRTKEVLGLLIEYLRRGILEEEDLNEAERLARRAEDVLREFSIPVTEYLYDEISRLIEAARSKGFEIVARAPAAPYSPGVHVSMGLRKSISFTAPLEAVRTVITWASASSMTILMALEPSSSTGTEPATEAPRIVAERLGEQSIVEG